MRVAILGAGLSGLCCANRLQHYGITFEIYEKRHRVGERFANMEAILPAVHRPMEDPFVFLSKNYNIGLYPAGIVHAIELIGPSNRAFIKGNLGYSTIRGHDSRSLECQLAASITSKINFNADCSYHQLVREFDYVIIATGDPTIPMDMGLWQTDTEVFVKGGYFRGNFDTGIIRMWLDYDLARFGYIFSAAMDQHHTSVALAATPSSLEEIDMLWERTKYQLRLEKEIDSSFKLEEYKIGRCKQHKIDNMLLTGNAAGFIDPFLGFGQVPAMLSGIYAAEAIAQGIDYELLLRALVNSYEQCLKIRELVNTLDNDKLDLMVNLLNRYFIKGPAFNTSLPVLKILSAISKPMKTAKLFYSNLKK